MLHILTMSIKIIFIMIVTHFDDDILKIFLLLSTHIAIMHIKNIFIIGVTQFDNVILKIFLLLLLLLLHKLTA